MNEVTIKVLEIFENNPNTFYSAENLAHILSIDNTIIHNCINDLINEKKIFINNEDKLQYVSNNIFIKTLQTTKGGNNYIELEDDEKLYIDKEKLNGAFSFDEVVVLKEEDKGKVIKIISRKNPNVVCEIENIYGIKHLQAFNVPRNISFNVIHEQLNDYVDGDRVLIKVSNVNHDGIFDAEVVKYLGHKDDPNSDIKVIAANHDFEFEFSDEVLKEIEKIPTEVKPEEIKDRLDLRDKLIFTIDGKDTKDIDDAISIEKLDNGNYLLGVHIANVSYYVKRGSAIFEDAYNRGTSVYLLNSVIPMLHHKLSNGICSLNPLEDRLAKSCIMEINNLGEVVNYKICNSVINSKKKMNYDDVNSILEDKIIPAGYEDFVNSLQVMEELSNILTIKRNNEGALEFASDEVKAHLDENGKATEFILSEQKSGEHLIENFMIIANETVASHISWLNLPCVYRVHACPIDKVLDSTINFISELGFKISNIKNSNSPKLVQTILKKLSNYEEYPILSNLLLRSMKRAYYTTKNIGHFGLATDMYTHFTSPIRRFPDLMVHTLLDKYDNIYNEDINLNEYLNKLEKVLEAACKHSSYKERQADLAESESNKYAMLECMEKYVGESFEGVILDIGAKGVKVKTENQISGIVKLFDVLNDTFTYNDYKHRLYGKNTNQQYRIGNKVLLTVKKIDKCKKEIYFYLEDNLSKNNTKKKVKKK